MAQTEADLLDNPVAGRPTLILRSPDFHSITEAVAEPVERKTPIGWWFFFIPSLALLGLLGVAVSWLFWEGIGVWDERRTSHRRCLFTETGSAKA